MQLKVKKGNDNDDGGELLPGCVLLKDVRAGMERALNSSEIKTLLVVVLRKQLQKRAGLVLDLFSMLEPLFKKNAMGQGCLWTYIEYIFQAKFDIIFLVLAPLILETYLGNSDRRHLKWSSLV